PRWLQMLKPMPIAGCFLVPHTVYSNNHVIQMTAWFTCVTILALAPQSEGRLGAAAPAPARSPGLGGWGPDRGAALVPAGPCDVTDGSGLSARYPCGCGREVCRIGEACGTDNTSCAMAFALTVSWPRECISIGSTTFDHSGTSASGAPIYSNGEGTYLYYDPSCDGSQLASLSQWIIDNDEPSLTAAADLDGDGDCSDFAHIAADSPAGLPSSGSTWQITCDGETFRAQGLGFSPAQATQRARARLGPMQTPAPTLEPGTPCHCDSCGGFPVYDKDGDGCLVEAEIDVVTELSGQFSGMDVDQDGCVNQSECATYVGDNGLDLESYFVPQPSECDLGFYVIDQTSVCLRCDGATTRRRSTSCTPCVAPDFDAGDFDDCVDGSLPYTLEPVLPGATAVVTSETEGIMFGDVISISPPDKSYFEEATVIGFGSIQLGHGLNQGFPGYSAVVRTCTKQDGISFSAFYPCGCGKSSCVEGQACDMGEWTGETRTENGVTVGTSGACVTLVRPGQPMPTPAPTVQARGDPHLVNLMGEHFDVNHGGDFELLRIPQNAAHPAEFSVFATIKPAPGTPCTTFITQVRFSGTWLDEKVLEVRSYLKNQSSEAHSSFLGARVLWKSEQESPWLSISEWGSDNLTLSSRDAYKVAVAKTQWTSHRSPRAGMPTVAGQFDVFIWHQQNRDAAKITVRQDLPSQEHLDVAVRRLSTMGRADIGGLLGFDEHPESLEDVTPECQRHRDGLDSHTGPRILPAWKRRWQVMKDRRGHGDGVRPPARGGEAAASLLVGSRGQLSQEGFTCICPDATSVGHVAATEDVIDELGNLDIIALVGTHQTAAGTEFITAVGRADIAVSSVCSGCSRVALAR
ncbi:unnamed protein product, partial [Prorocentrum cordatum]